MVAFSVAGFLKCFQSSADYINIDSPGHLNVFVNGEHLRTTRFLSVAMNHLSTRQDIRYTISAFKGRVAHFRWRNKGR
jgi:hypothetical protein